MERISMQVSFEVSLKEKVINFLWIGAWIF